MVTYSFVDQQGLMVNTEVTCVVMVKPRDDIDASDLTALNQPVIVPSKECKS